MRKFIFLFAVAVLSAIVFMQLTSKKALSSSETSSMAGAFVFPDHIKVIIDKSCYGCHSVDGKSDEAKDALRWDLMGEYDKEKLVSVFDEIIEVIEEREMPPKKFLEKYPDAQPSDEAYATLMLWAEEEAEKLFE